MAHIFTRRCAVLLLAAACLAATGCAVFDRNNTPVLNAVEKHMLPSSQPWRTLAMPVLVPVGLGAVAIDGLIVHPASVIDDAWDDTSGILDSTWDITKGIWDDMDWHRHYASNLASLVSRGIGTVIVPPVGAGCFGIVFGGRFAWLAAFDVDHSRQSRRVTRAERERQRQEQALTQLEWIQSAEDALAKKQFKEARGLADKALAINAKDRARALATRMAVDLEAGDMDAFIQVAMDYHYGYLAPRAFGEPLLQSRALRLLATGERNQRATLLAVMTNGPASRAVIEHVAVFEAVRTIALGKDAALAGLAVSAFGNHRTHQRARSALQEAARSKDPVVSAAAKAYLIQPR